MRKLLIALNILLIATIIGVWFFWNPQPEELPLQGTYAEKLGHDIPPEATPSTPGSQPASSAGVKPASP